MILAFVDYVRLFFIFTHPQIYTYGLAPQYITTAKGGGFLRSNKSTAIKTTPGSQLFDPLNGNHLLYMINFFGTSVGSFRITDGQKAEKFISRLPVDVKSEIDVFNWLKGQYLYYWNSKS